MIGFNDRAPTAVEFTKDTQAVANGVLVIRAGLFSNCVRLLPPLTMPEAMLREGLAALGRAIEVCSTIDARSGPA